ncbi:hypothetical protein MMC22_006242 [Lobaria immixta]|nr:hypothetical protein [Lobaria immixta]
MTGNSGQMNVHRSRRSESAARFGFPSTWTQKQIRPSSLSPSECVQRVYAVRIGCESGPAPVADVCADGPDDGDARKIYPLSPSADVPHVVPGGSHESCKHAVTEHQGSAFCFAIKARGTGNHQRLCLIGFDTPGGLTLRTVTAVLMSSLDASGPTVHDDHRSPGRMMDRVRQDDTIRQRHRIKKQPKGLKSLTESRANHRA